jgi:hypothetical protein
MRSVPALPEEVVPACLLSGTARKLEAAGVEAVETEGSGAIHTRVCARWVRLRAVHPLLARLGIHRR